ncbi:MAG: S9 family peptidase [Acidobacteria bacterium]|nr:MAG: S9 family peptidase [Acidobacteriota bacterium]
MGLVGGSIEISAPISAFSRSITPRRSRTCAACTCPALTERMICLVWVPHPSPVLARVGDTNDKTLKAGSSTTQDHSQANDPASVGMTANKEREIISDQDADRPRWAPDGKRFAFVSNKEKGSQIWVADFDGASGTVTAKHRLTNIATEASGELWSPDGKNILFKSDVYPECDATPAKESACNAKKVDEARNSKVKAQIFTHLLYRHWNAYKEGKQTHLFVIPVEGCATNHVGRGALTRAGELYSPDAAQSAAGRVGAPAPTRDEKGSGPCSVARDLTPGDYDAPVFSLGGQDNYAFSPDRQEICYASNHDREPAISTNNDLFTVPVRVGAGDSPAQVLAATKDITSENKAADNTPLYSPDGKYIAYRAQQRPGYESDRWRLMLYDRKTAKTYDTLRGDLDRWVGSFTWAPDSKAIYLSTEDKGESPIRYFFVGGDLFGEKHDASDAQQTGSQQEKHKFIEQEWARLYSVEVEGGYNDDLTIVGNGTRLLFTRMSISAPNEIQVLSIRRPTIEPKRPFDDGATPIVLTRLNDSVLSQVSMSPLESFWFPGANGDKVQGFLVRPPNFDPNKKYPVKFLIHGGPQGAWGDDWSYRWNPELFAAPTSSGPGYVVIMINFHGSTGYGQKFIDAINGDWGGAAFEDLMKGLDYAEQHYPFIDKDRECALGASYGGYMANWIIGHTNRFKCIVSHDGMFNTESAWGDTEELWFNEWEFKGTPYANREQYRKWSPHLSATNFKTPTLVVHGQLDYRLDVSQGFDLFTTLQRQGVPSKMLYFPDEGHWVLKPQNSQVWYKTVNDWVDQWVGK